MIQLTWDIAQTGDDPTLVKTIFTVMRYDIVEEASTRLHLLDGS